MSDVDCDWQRLYDDIQKSLRRNCFTEIMRGHRRAGNKCSSP
jgi:hypothetical protein